MNPSVTLKKTNLTMAVCCLFVAAVLVSGCTAGRVNLEIQDAWVNPWSSPVPKQPYVH